MLTMSPVTIPWPSAPTLTAAGPVSTPALIARSTPASATQRRNHVDEIEGCADCPLGVVLVSDRCAP